jgi:hypothetical protein
MVARRSEPIDLADANTVEAFEIIGIGLGPSECVE